MRLLRAENNTNDGTSGGRPLNVDILATGTFPRFSSALDPQEFFRARKMFWFGDSDTEPAQLAKYGLFDLVDSTFGLQYYNYIPCIGADGLRSTYEDIEPDLSTLRRYGAGRLTVAASAGATSLTVNVKDAALASGIERIFRANGAGVKDNLYVDKRTSPGLLDWTQIEHIVATNAVAVGSTVSITLETALVNAYPVGAKVRSVPDDEDLVAGFDGVDKADIGTTTFDENALVAYNASTWVDEIELEILTPGGNYKLTSSQFGLHPETFNKANDVSPTWSALGLAGPQFKIPAGTVGGENVAGHKVRWRTNAAMHAAFFVLHHPANAGLKSHSSLVLNVHEI